MNNWKRKGIAVIIVSLFAFLLLIIREWNITSALMICPKESIMLKGKTQKVWHSLHRPLSWSVEDPKILKVDKKGNITALSAGETMLHAKYWYKEVKCPITVEDPTLNFDHLQLQMGQRIGVWMEHTSFKPTVSLSGDSITYEDGMITARHPGNSTLTFSIQDLKKECQITVKQPIVKDYSCKKGKVIKPILEDAPIWEVPTWKVENKQIAKIEKSKVKGLNVGVTKLSTKIGGDTYESTLKVLGKVHLSIESKDILLGKKEKVSIKGYIPGYKVQWENANPLPNGQAEIEGKQRGELTLKATVDTGIQKEKVEKTIHVLDKKLNITNWKGEEGDSFTLTMQDAQNPTYQYNTTFLSLKGNTFTAKKACSTIIHVIDGETDLVCQVQISPKKVPAPGNSEFLNQLSSMGDKIWDNGLSYSRNASSRPFAEASNYNCAIYVCWTLQEMGLIPEDKFFWFNEHPHGSGFDYMQNHPETFTILHPNCSIMECDDIQVGDICGFTINGYAPHTAVFAGWENEHPVWYSGGSGDSKHGNFGPSRHSYYEQNNDTIYTIVRLK